MIKMGNKNDWKAITEEVMKEDMPQGERGENADLARSVSLERHELQEAFLATTEACEVQVARAAIHLHLYG